MLAAELLIFIEVGKQSAGRSDLELCLESSNFFLPIISLTHLSVFQPIIFCLLLQTEDVFTKLISALMCTVFIAIDFGCPSEVIQFPEVSIF